MEQPTELCCFPPGTNVTPAYVRWRQTEPQDLGWPWAGLILPCTAPYLRHHCQQRAQGRGEKRPPMEQGAALPSKHCTQSPRGRPGKQQRPGAGRAVAMARVSGRLLPPARRESQPGSASPTSRPRLGTSRRGSGAGRRGRLLPAQLEPPKSEPLLSAAFYRAIKPQVHVQTLAGISLGHLQHRFSTSRTRAASVPRASFPRAQPPAAPQTDKRTRKDGHTATPAPAKWKRYKRGSEACHLQAPCVLTVLGGPSLPRQHRAAAPGPSRHFGGRA